MAIMGILLISGIALFYLPSHSIIMTEVFENKEKVSVNYYLTKLAPRDPESKRILHGYGRYKLFMAIKEGRVKVEGGLLVVESLKNL